LICHTPRLSVSGGSGRDVELGGDGVDDGDNAEEAEPDWKQDRATSCRFLGIR
jgi:hypothetical protein